MQVYGRLDTYNHLVLVARKPEEAVRHWADAFGFDAPPVLDTTPYFKELDMERVPSYYRGQPWHCEFKQAVFQQPEQFFEIDGAGSRDGFSEFLDRHGDGMMYFGILAGAQRDALVDRLVREMGRTVILDQKFPGGDWCVLDTEALLGCDLCVKSVTCVENKDHIAVNDFTDMALLVPDLSQALSWWRQIFNVEMVEEGDFEFGGNTCRVARISDGLFPVYLIETAACQPLEQHRQAHGGLFFLGMKAEETLWNNVKARTQAQAVRFTFFGTSFECLFTIDQLATNIANRI